MRTGEKWILGIIAVIVLVVMGRNLWQLSVRTEPDRGIPFYTTASPELNRAGWELYRELNCKSCHSLWTVSNIMQSVPSPNLDGIGSLYDEDWFYAYFSAENPQSIVPTRLKEEYQHPSYAYLPESERRTLAAYMASLKVEDWYLQETRAAEYEALTGEEFSAED